VNQSEAFFYNTYTRGFSVIRLEKGEDTLSNVLRSAPVWILALLALAYFATPALAQTYTVTVQTDQPSYTGSQTITITGTVSPAPGPNTAVILSTKNSNGTVVDYQNDPVNSATGAYAGVIVAGGTVNWIPGTYIVNATWGGDATSAIQTITFLYTPTVTTTSSTTTSSTTTTSTTTTSSATTSSTTNSTSTSSTTSTSTSSSPPVTVTSTVTTTTSASSSSTSTSSGGISSSVVYGIVAVVVIILAVVGIMMWRKRVASSYGKQATTK